MKIQKLLEGKYWNGYAWIGGASDEGHPDFDPLQQSRGGYVDRRYGPRPPRPKKNMIVVKMPYDAKDIFKELAGKGNYSWEGETKTWRVNAAILTDRLRRLFAEYNIEIVEPKV